MKWLEALKKWNAGKAKWSIPKSGSQGHKEILALMGKK